MFRIFFFFITERYIFPVAPRVVPFSFEDGPAQTGQYVNVQCLVPEGDLPILIKWVFNGNEIEDDSDINISNIGKRSSVLTIEPVAAKHSGNYTCYAKNSVGSAEYSSELKVIGYYYTMILYSNLHIFYPSLPYTCPTFPLVHLSLIQLLVI